MFLSGIFRSHTRLNRLAFRNTSHPRARGDGPQDVSLQQNRSSNPAKGKTCQHKTSGSSALVFESPTVLTAEEISMNIATFSLLWQRTRVHVSDFPPSFNPVPVSRMISPPFREHVYRSGRKAQQMTELESRHQLPGEFIMQTYNHCLITGN